jgi:large repetitive protein
VPEIFIDTAAESGTYAVGMGSIGSDGTLSQTVATTAGKTYTLSFWLQNEGSGGNDFTATWNGQTLLSLTNATQSGYKQYTYTVTATGGASTLNFSAANGPSQWDLDNVSLTASGTAPTPPIATPTITKITDSPATGALSVGTTVALTLAFSEIVTVSGGKPTLTLNDGGTATYASGSGTTALTFTYTVAAGQNAASLAATAVNLPSGITIEDSAGSAASLSLS